LAGLFSKLSGWLNARRRVDAAPAHAPEEEEACEDVDPFDPFPEPVRLEIKDVFDLHTVPPRDVRAVVEEYLREARRLGYRQVRIIHGKGVGVQRETVRAVLARTPFVEHFADAPPEAGGWGATVARLTREQKP
jgi:dsDNA-specific endonuclease/ATPase MutS2